jgi:hypothetical protein
MPESFDAFYARTVGNVTSQMHALAGGDGAADHAIREAYARAYQQWYEVAGFRDSEEWVLTAAREAYQRRRPEAAPVIREESTGYDSLSWPGLYRSAPVQAEVQPSAEPSDHVAGGPPTATAEVPPGGLFGGRPAAPAASASLFAGGAPGGVLPDWAAQAQAGSSDEASLPGSADPAAASDLPATAPAGSLADRFRRPRPGLRTGLLGSRRNLIAAAVALAVVVAAVVVYAATGSNSAGHGARPGPSAKAAPKPAVHMLPAGRTGSRATIPWSLIGPGWTLAELSTAHPDANGAAAGGGRYITYLVDPEGGRYRIRATTGSALDLIAWSGDSKFALYSVGPAGAGGAQGYGVLTLATGRLRSLPLPAGVAAVGFTRPDGLNILAVREGHGKYRLERFTRAGAHAANLASLPRPSADQGALEGNALSSPDGDTVVWGVRGDEMQLVSNAGGHARKLHVPASGSPPWCTPISWWSSDTILAFCNDASAAGAGRLWLVRDTGSSTALTGASGSDAGSGELTGAWQSAGAVYVTSTTTAQCPTAATGPGGQQILRLGAGGAEAQVSVPDSLNHHAAVVAGVGARLLVLAQTSCPGTSSLIWFNPSTHAAQTVLTAPSTEVGVVAAVPFGSGPAATSNGLN